ncbi:hypothetical protein A3C25_00350 [Candidatus Roizmanbacteria bacterium RIFCSPHIGHO2_02_FULL_38_11]|uniref:Hydrolase TatD n=1 Tax=Candidatus Roizmanbacteria bacterium RIFCSPHIGHO2_02_FULL_38_11 TaxID=1802039 RepID=A0A1F7H231_9BACT|nr:MAG: hypothetical protein A3C25_00350 [Candidatus Roizmanbacteria bacterium RIFCSPHIGHO2_02_FULL_38_11]
MFDTHCHLNFKAFDGKVDGVIESARNAGVNYFVVPGTDVESSKKAVEIAEKFKGVYAAVGIHPHHIYQYQIAKIKYQSFDKLRIDPERSRMDQKYILNIKNDLIQIERLLTSTKVVAVGEVGIDRHIYKNTKYQDYNIGENFIDLQKEFFIEQLKLAHKYKKTLIIHNREAKKDILEVLSNDQQLAINNRIVFHCCEPDFVETGHAPSLLRFAKKHKIYIGVDGDVTYWKEKQDFVKKIPLEMLVLETDSPFILPRLNRDIGKQEKHLKFPNEPKNLPLIASCIAAKIGISLDKLEKITEENSKKLFGIS